MNPLSWNFRRWFLFGFLCCAALLGFAFYVQHGMLRQPCNLCILQRLAFMWMGVFFLLGALHGPKSRFGRSVYGVLTSIGGVIGAAIAAWHLRMQNLPPDQVPSCNSMDMGYLLKAFSPAEVFEKIFMATGDCAKVEWALFGVSMPGWTLLWYVFLTVVAWYAVFRPIKRRYFVD